MKKLNSLETAIEKLKLSDKPTASKNVDQFIKVVSNDQRKPKVFLGGTCNGSTWRDELIPFLDEAKIKYFNPVVEDWNEKAKALEDKEKAECGIHLYVITPEMTGLYSIAEVVDSAYKNPKGTFLVVVGESNDMVFNKAQLKSLSYVMDLVDIVTSGANASFFTKLDDNTYKVITQMLSNVKRGFPNRVFMTVQSHPSSYCGVNGIQVYDIINFGKQVLKALNSEVSCVESADAVRKLSGALSDLDKRTEDRIARGVEGKNKK